MVQPLLLLLIFASPVVVVVLLDSSVSNSSSLWRLCNMEESDSGAYMFVCTVSFEGIRGRK